MRNEQESVETDETWEGSQWDESMGDGIAHEPCETRPKKENPQTIFEEGIHEAQKVMIQQKDRTPGTSTITDILFFVMPDSRNIEPLISIIGYINLNQVYMMYTYDMTSACISKNVCIQTIYTHEPLINIWVNVHSI